MQHSEKTVMILSAHLLIVLHGSRTSELPLRGFVRFVLACEADEDTNNIAHLEMCAWILHVCVHQWM